MFQTDKDNLTRTYKKDMSEKETPVLKHLS